jgi:hypothetical protein
MHLRDLGLALVALAPLAACQTANSVGQGAGEVRAGLGDAISAPLEDLNIKRTPIPPALIRALANPYAIGGMDHCEAIAAEVGSLDDALGPDADMPPPDQTAAQVDADRGAKMTLGFVHNAAESALPFHSWMRQLSGADRHRRDVQAAIKAGQQRRGFLKALGMSLNCAPPASPSWYKPHPRLPSAPPPPSPPSVADGSAAAAAQLRPPAQASKPLAPVLPRPTEPPAPDEASVAASSAAAAAPAASEPKDPSGPDAVSALLDSDAAPAKDQSESDADSGADPR